MSVLPVVEHHVAHPPAELRRRVARLAARLRRERPELAVPEMFRPLLIESLQPGGRLHLDDISGIPFLDPGRDIRFKQEQARARASTGDLVASCAAPVDGYEDYCRERLGLGAPEWLHPQPLQDPLQLAAACWRDRSVRERLLRAVRSGELLYVEPYIGSLAVWELAALVSDEARQPLCVLAPPPGVAEWANDKVAFAEAVRLLFGDGVLPETTHAGSFSLAAERLRGLADHARMLSVKLPDSIGGGGNIVLEAARLRGHSLQEISDVLQRKFNGNAWNQERELLISAWETDVESAPSGQLWIPPVDDGPPVFEGIFEQRLEGAEGFFVGSRPAELDDGLQQEIVDRCWLLARLFQELGYVGRCSFDLLVVGDGGGTGSLRFIECNGRWGGASTPMTLMNRLFGDWRWQPYAASGCRIDGLDRMAFRDLLDALEPDLYDARTGDGTYILLNPAKMQARSGITVIALAETWHRASELAEACFPETVIERVAGSRSR
jgi:Pre ATP-grasp domain